MGIKSMTEIDFEKAIVDVAHTFGWRVASFRPAQTSKGWRTPVKYDGKGWPDLVLIHSSGHIIFAELKREGGKQSLDQEVWGEALTMTCEMISLAVGFDACRYELWRPSDSGMIVQILSFGKVMEWRLA